MRITINFYRTVITYESQRIDIDYDDRYVYIAPSECNDVAFPRNDVESIEIEGF